MSAKSYQRSLLMPPTNVFDFLQFIKPHCDFLKLQNIFNHLQRNFTLLEKLLSSQAEPILIG